MLGRTVKGAEWIQGMLTVRKTHVGTCLLLLTAAGTVSAANLHTPVSFEANRGQGPAEADFFARGKVFLMSLRSDRIDWRARDSRVTAFLEGARHRAAEPDRRLPGVVHYLNPKVNDIPTYQRVSYRGVYPGVDLVFYGREGRVEYDFIVAPGTDPARIRMRYDGARSLTVDSSGDLLVETGAGTLHQPRPEVYQESHGMRREIAGGYRVRGNRVQFEVGPYDRTLPLVIDPAMAWASYLGIESAYTNGESMAVDTSGYIYVGGTITALNGSEDAFVDKLTPDGSTRVFRTILPGKTDDTCHAIAVDSNGNIYLGGDSNSVDFIVKGPLSAYSLDADDMNKAWLAKLDPDGKTFLYSGFLGGALSDTTLGLATDASNNVYVVGGTYSRDFPVTPNATQSTLNGVLNAFVMKLDSKGNRLYSTYLGSTELDTAFSVAVDSDGNFYVGGDTQSDAFPVTSKAIQPHRAGDNEPFVAKFSPDGVLLYSTLLGGSDYDSLCAVAVDASGGVYVAGITRSKDFPVMNALQPTLAGVSDLFIAKLDLAAGTLVYSTYLGGTGLDATTTMTVDPAGNLYVTGITTSKDFPLRDAFQKVNAGPMNGVVVALDKTGALLLSSYIGGSGTPDGKQGDTANYLALNCAGGLVVMGDTFSTDFPATAGAFSTVFHGTEDVYVAKIASGGNAVISSNGVVNAASLSVGPVAPASALSILGTGLALATQQASTSPAPTDLAGTSVLINGKPVPILAASYGRVDVQLPPDLVAGVSSVAVSVPCGTTPAVNFTVAPIAPYVGLTSKGDAMAFHMDGSLVTTENPAKAGTSIMIALTGVGAADNPNVTASIGGFDAAFQGLSVVPSAAGWVEAKLTIPAGMNAGPYSVVLTVGGVASNSAQLYVQ